MGGQMDLTRRTLLRTTAALPAAALPTAFLSDPASAAGLTDLGIPLHDVLLIGGAVGPGPDGKPVVWSAVNGDPAHLAAIDPVTAKTVSYQALDGAPGSYAVAIGPDGTVWVGAYGTGVLYRRRPGKDSPVESLGQPIASETYIWRLAVDSTGTVYGCTYPTARAFAYHPGTGQVRDYGTVHPGGSYARSIAECGRHLYVGTQPDAHLMRVDKLTGAITELPLPPDLGNPAGVPVYDLNAYDGRVYARFGTATSGRLGVYTIDSGRWSPLRDNVAGLDVSAPGPNGLVYYTRNATLTALKPATGTETATAVTFTGRVVNNRGIGWVDLHDKAWPGPTLVGLLWRGELFRYNPRTRKSDLRLTDVPGEPIPLASLAIGSTGRLWAGGYLNGGVATVDPDSGAPTFYRFAQTESVLDLGDTVWLGCYPDARLYRYDPSLPWNSSEYAPGPPGSAENPVKVADLSGQDQVRARTSVDGGTWVAYGSMPNTTLGGCLVVVDKATNTATVHRPVVTDQSIVSLAVAAGQIVGGTSIHGGYSVPAPTQKEAVVFTFDPTGSATTSQVVPVPGADSVDALVTDPDGIVWGVAGGRLFAFDVASRTVTRGVDVPAGPGRLAYHQGTDSFLVLADGTLLRVARADLTVTTLAQQQATFLAVDAAGRAFLGDDTTIYRWDPS